MDSALLSLHMSQKHGKEIQIASNHLCLHVLLLTFDLPFLVFQSNLRRLGAQICGLFVEVKQENFVHHLDNLLLLLEREINPDNYEDVRQRVQTQV